jgi:hypothetical protein
MAMQALFKSQLDSFLEMVERAQVERGAAFIVELRARYPMISHLLEAALAGSSTEALAALAKLHPAIAEIPNALEFVVALQERLRNPPPASPKGNQT